MNDDSTKVNGEAGQTVRPDNALQSGDASAAFADNSALPPWVPSSIEELQQLVVLQNDRCERLSAAISELGNLFDAAHPLLDQVDPDWWKVNNPIARILEELDGWQPQRVLEAKKQLGLIIRGLSHAETRRLLQERREALSDEQRKELQF